MIDKDKFHIFNYIKKEEYLGSIQGMRYMLKKTATDGETKIEVIIWPEPLGYAKTPEDKKQRVTFDFTTEGLMEAVDWLNSQYLVQKPLWDISLKYS